MLSLEYEFSAVPYVELLDVGHHYDIIMLAPQISYMHAKVQEMLKDKLVLKISSQIFAKYDAGSAMTMLNDEMNKWKKQREVSAQPSLKRKLQNNMKILAIALVRIGKRVYLNYSLYNEDNQIILENAVRKNRISLEDICDVLDTVFAKYLDIELVSISMPGIINEGRLTLRGEGFNDCDVEESLTRKYGKRFVLCNDVNCIAVGYYASQDPCSSLSFLFQPNCGYPGGIGSIYNGQLIRGHKNIAGEAQYLPVYYHDNAVKKAKTHEGALDVVAQTIVSLICIYGPELIVYFCQLLIEKDELIKDIEKYIPKEYIPEIREIDSLREYILLGAMILGVQTYRES